jgi:DNA-binding MarR family transcriptional regulator
MNTRNSGNSEATTATQEVETSTDLIVKQWKAERPDLDLTAFEIVLRVRGLSFLIERHGRPSAEVLGIKSSELWVLYALRRGGKPYRMRPTDIFKLLNVTSGTLTYRIDRLEKNGLVKRVPNPNDRRSVMIQLTAKGKRGVDLAMETAVREASLNLRPITQDKALTQQLIGLLRLLGALYDSVIPDAENPLLHEVMHEVAQDADRPG